VTLYLISLQPIICIFVLSALSYMLLYLNICMMHLDFSLHKCIQQIILSYIFYKIAGMVFAH